MFAAEKPVSHYEDEDDCIDGRDVVHSCKRTRQRLFLATGVFCVQYDRLTAGQNWLSIWERIHNQGERRPEQGHVIRKETKASKPEGAMLDVVTAFHEKESNRDGVRDIQEHNTSCNHAIIGIPG